LAQSLNGPYAGKKDCINKLSFALCDDCPSHDAPIIESTTNSLGINLHAFMLESNYLQDYVSCLYCFEPIVSLFSKKSFAGIIPV
jgi:hypothetical protein